jgi:hypothetical protein
MSLKSGHKIVRRSWEEIPMPDVVIDRVKTLGKDQPEQLPFMDRKGRLIGDVEIPGVYSDEADDANEIPGLAFDDAAEAQFPYEDLDDAIEIPGVDYVEAPEGTAPQIVETNDLDIPVDQATTEEETVEVETVQEVRAPEAPAPVAKPEPVSGLRRSARGVQPESNRQEVLLRSNTTAESRPAKSRRTHVRARGFLPSRARRRGYHHDATIAQGWFESMGPEGLNGCLVRDEAASFPGHVQAMALVQPVRDPTPDRVGIPHVSQGEAMRKIKGRTAAGGNKQRDYISKEDASLPTVATESVLLSCIVHPNAHWRGEGYGIHQDSWSPSGYPSGHRSRRLQALCLERQERRKTVAGAMPERPRRSNGRKSVVLSQVRQESDGHRLYHQSVRFVRSQ